MASSVLSSTTVVTKRVSPSQANIIPPFTGLKSTATFPLTRKSYDNTSIASDGVTTHCIKVWPTTGMRKFETLSYLPPLTEEQLAKEVDYLILNKWIPCLEFTLGDPFVTRKYNSSPGYYDGRYWTMWKLPMYGATDSAQVLAEVQEVKKLHPDAFVRIIGFDNVRQVQCISFIAYTPPEYTG